MAKRHPLKTRALGAEPGLPDVAGLAAWIGEHRGRVADITTYLLDRSLAPQVAAGIDMPCAGGKFYGDRIRQCITGIEDDRATGELHFDSSAVIEDAAGIVLQAKGAWCAMPAPHVLGIRDAHYDDEDEWNTAICDMYRTIMRTMRDTGVAGHVLITGRADDFELASLARQKVFFFAPSPDRDSLAGLMEHQKQIAARRDLLETVFDLTGEYTLRQLFIVDPNPASIELALSHLDPDQVVAAGYRTGSEDGYWKDLVSRAIYER